MTETTENDFVPLGTVLNERYLLTKLLASGGTSYVYKGRDLLAGEDSHFSGEIVIKIARNHIVSGAEVSLREALLTRQLCHPNIARIYSYDQQGPLHYVVMEYVQGETLAERLMRQANKRLDYPELSHVMRSIAAALQTAHTARIVHSDLKPSNILISNKGVVKVIDFATARAVLEPATHDKLLTDTEFFGYTPAYASPQTLRDEPPSPSDDIFSLACIVYECLCGAHPFGRIPSVEAESQQRQPQRPSGLSGWQWRALKRALAFEENARYHNVQAFTADFLDTRYRTLKWGAAATLVTALVAGYINWTGELNQSFPLLGEHSSAAQTQQAQQLIAELRAAAPLQRHQLLDKLNQLSGLYRQGALFELQNDVTAPILEEVKASLYARNGDPDFARIDRLVQDTLPYYPHAAQLEQAQQLINEEKRALSAALVLDILRLWSSTDFSRHDTQQLSQLWDTWRNINGTAEAAPVPPKPVLNRYMQELDEALSRDDLMRIADLLHFQTRQPQVTAFAETINLYDPAMLKAAATLAEHHSDPARARQAYPVAAAETFWRPRIKALTAQLEAASSAAETEAVHQALIALRDYFPAEAFAPYEALLALSEDQYERQAASNRVESRATLSEKLQNQWALTDFQQYQADAIANTAKRLGLAGGRLPPLDQEVGRRFRVKLQEAIAANNFYSIARLGRFQATLAAIPDTKAWLNNIDPELIKVAQTLARHAKAGGPAPQQAAAYFWKKYYSDLNGRLDKPWSELDLDALKLEVESPPAYLPKDYEPLRQAREKLSRLLKQAAESKSQQPASTSPQSARQTKTSS